MASTVSVSKVVPVPVKELESPPKPIPASPSSSIGTVDEVSSSRSSSDLEGVAVQLCQESLEQQDNQEAETKKPMKILFLSADTGGGHRASAESLAKQFLIHFPGSSYDLLDIWTDDGVWPYNSIVKSYKHFSANPSHWRFFYHLTNAKPVSDAMVWHSTLSCEKKIRSRIEQYEPDIIVSVHPTMQHAPLISCRQISKAQNKYIPFFTVVTDLASAHATWFEKDVDKVYLASQPLYKLAQERKHVPENKIVMAGLPIRHDFAAQAKKLRDRNSLEGQMYQKSVKSLLGIDPNRPMILVMGGGEGVGGLSSIVNELYAALCLDGVDATICVVCGRNEMLKADLENRDWEDVLYGEFRSDSSTGSFCLTHEQPIHPKLLQSAFVTTVNQEEKKEEEEYESSASSNARGYVTVKGLGFITNMAEYMVAAHVLVSKAGPGTISEAAAVGLPVMLTSYLPGQEAGNVEFVLENGFGDYCKDPLEIGNVVSNWLQDSKLLQSLSQKATETGHPNAAAEIVIDIGNTAQQWLS